MPDKNKEDKPLRFKDFLSVDYTQTGDENQAVNAKKRKKDIPTGNTNEEAVETDEALDITQRRALSRALKRNKSKIQMGRKRASKRIATIDKLKIRARKQARDILVRKLTKDIPKSELSMARKKDIETRLEKPAMKAKIDRIARKNLPKVRQAEIQKKRGKKSDDKPKTGN
jgi:hypothetical protein